ncbi:uncharacterized protein LOC8077457 isoform X1 [Sorghum bicolor]|uniref:FAD-binding domain-containing protein n=1 Tax=Sorghum bicolor TaxID=4558 RepID=C5X956_SORBI|nr:uncharacterized protein LOC8077457 isoform X1 [Sorghum bicolor]EER99394.2 hypothetical protein SORBI_3002G306800 [Sorghum bicolor]|eukprot:XP_021309625.1 uncharacterized protein LOC8077457 isoform X1 [Sorghum bicolor]
MALATATISSPQLRYCPSPRGRRRRRGRHGAAAATVAASATPRSSEENIVIVGAGVAGLATAVALRRLGVGAAVLEQGDALRAGGTSLTLFKNGWRVLDAIGVADELRSKYLRIQGMRMRSPAAGGRELREFSFEEEAPGQEVRAVERRVLLETLSSKLPPGTISFSSKLKSISEQGPAGGTLLELEDGRQILSKIVIGCDGVNSPIAKWMGFSEPRYVGHMAFRGLAEYADGQPFEPKVNYIYGRGVRAGFVPVSPTKVYWFICFNRPDPGPKITDPAALKSEALELVRGWPSDLLAVMRSTPEGAVVRTPLVDRWLWPGLAPAASRGGRVVLAGDAWHPMTPNLGQGACCALEDAVILARRLADAGGAQAQAAMRAYEAERWARVFPLTARAGLVGALVQWDNAAVCAARDGVVIPRLVRLGPFLEHTNFECDLLEPAPQSP